MGVIPLLVIFFVEHATVVVMIVVRVVLGSHRFVNKRTVLQWQPSACQGQWSTVFLLSGEPVAATPRVCLAIND